ncbi:DUF819 family protein [uncultured Maricaulis sp.]|uniref:DUF819 family protein n=1 Tax=uncultured Maricaulis sp. TaxID=174710 RepID=UPI0030D875ED|tara:strand:+ start:41562 stop:42818 length:1257 start_codon:yes stop_codon:yes gene_type:complete
METELEPLISNDAVVLGLLTVILGAVFWTSTAGGPFFRRFYQIFPPLLLCYFLPSLLNTFNIVDPDQSRLYFVASRYLLPAALVLLAMSADLPATLRLGPKALTMFLTGTIGVIIGGPIALLIASSFMPDLIGVDGPDAVWRGMTTVAGSWIGGSANQTAMYEIFDVGDQIFSAWIAVDVIVANIWMAFLLIAANNAAALDKRLGADARSVDHLRIKAEAYEAEHARIPELRDMIFIAAIGFGAVAIAHFASDLLAPWFTIHYPELVQYSLHSGFFWLIIVATFIGVTLSFTPARKLSGAGSMKTGSVFIYILVATIGMNMDITAIARNPEFFLIGLIWVMVHASLLILMAILIKAPVFFLAVGSQANIGGAASAPVVASAFHPSLAPVGVLLAVVGYVIGTGGAWLTGQILRIVAGA